MADGSGSAPVVGERQLRGTRDLKGDGLWTANSAVKCHRLNFHEAVIRAPPNANVNVCGQGTSYRGILICRQEGNVAHVRNAEDPGYVAGSRTTGGEAQTYAITGPAWTGTLPQSMKEVRSSTGMVWTLGRVYERHARGLQGGA